MAQNFLSDIKLGDDIYIRLGDATNGDLQIYHDGDHSYIQDAGTGELRLAANVFRVLNANTSETMIYAEQDGKVQLRFNESTKFETNTNGIKIVDNLGIGVNPSSVYGIYQDFNSTDPNIDNKFAYFIDADFSGADNTDGDREQGGIRIDIDSTADGDADDEHRLYGVWSDVRYSGFTDIARAGYFFAENNNSTGSEKTLETIGVYASAVGDGTNANAGTNNLKGVHGQASVQNVGYVSAAYGGFFNSYLAGVRTADANQLVGVRGEVEIDSSSSITLGNARAVQAIIDVDNTTPTVTNSFLYHGTYEGDTSNITNRYGIFVQNSALNRIDGVTMFEGGTAAAPIIARLADVDTGIYFPATDTIGFTTGGTERVRITSGGGVGIGTDNPTGKFNSYISATRQLTHNGNGGDLSIISDNNSSPVFYVKGTGTADLVNVFDNTSEVFTILDGGNVGIRVTSPAKDLVINNATGARLQLQFNGNDRFRMEADSFGGSFYSPAGYGARFFTSGSERMRIASDGTITLSAYGAGYLKTDANGVISVDTDTIEDTLQTVTDRGSTTTNTMQGTRLGLGAAPHASAALQITTTAQHMRLNNGTELGIIHLLSGGELELWAHGDGETINFRTGSGSGSLAAHIDGTNTTFQGDVTVNQDLIVGNAAGSSTTATFGSFDQLRFDNSYNDTNRGPNKIVMHNNGGAWAGGFGVHTDTVAYYSGANHTFYKTTSQTASTELLKIESTGATFAGNINAGSNTVTAATFIGDLNGTINTATTAATQSASDNSTKVATTAYVDTAVTNLVDSSPAALDTLNELAAALGDDANFSTTVTNSIATKVAKAGDTMTGNLVLNNSVNLRFKNNAGAERNILTLDTNDDVQFGGSIDDIRFLTNDSSDKMIIKSDGKVGVGTISPQNILHVHQSDADSHSYVHITQEDGGSASTDGMSIGVLDGGVNASVRLRENGYLNFWTNNTERMRIASDGKVGIGTTSPENLLHIKAADGVTGVLKIEGGKNTVTSVGEINSQIDFGSNDGSVWSTGNVGGRIASVTETTNGAFAGMAFYTFRQGVSSPDSLSEKVRITNDGKVGIGATSPYKKLEVTGDIQLDGTDANIWIKSGAAGTNGFINWTFNTDDTVYNKVGIDYNTRATTGFHIDAGYPITIDATTRTNFAISGSNKGAWDSTGLGIGTTSPSTKLYVDNGESTFNRGNSAGTIATFRGQNAAKAAIGTATSYFLSDVGIGTASPSTELHVKASSGFAEARLAGASGSGSSLEFYEDTTALADIYANTSKDLIFRNNGTTERLRITSVGQFQYPNTGNESSLLTYSANQDKAITEFYQAQNYPTGNAYTRSFDIVASGDSTGGGQIRFLTSAGNTAPAQALLLDTSKNATFAGDIELDENLTFTTNNYVDIANTGTGAMRFKPSSSTLALTLAGANATFEGNIITSGNILLNENRIIARNTSDGSDSGYIAVVGGGAESDGRGAIIRYYGNEHASDAGRLAISSGNVSGAYIDFRVAGNERMRIASDGAIQTNADNGTPLQLTGIANGGQELRMRQSRGTVASPTNSSTNGDGNYLTSYVYANSAYASIGHIGIITGSATNDGEIQFSTASGGTVSERARITSTGEFKGPILYEMKNNAGDQSNATSPRIYSPSGGTFGLSAGGAERLTINSTGATFAGTVTSTGPTTIKSIAGSGQESVLNFSSTNVSGFGSTYAIDSKIRSITADSSNAYASELQFFTSDTSDNVTLALTLDESQNATFAGTVTVNGGQILTPSGVNLALNPNTGLVTVGGVIQCTGTGTSTFAGQVKTTSNSGFFVDGTVDMSMSYYQNVPSTSWGIFTSNNHADTVISTNLRIDGNHDLITNQTHSAVKGSGIVFTGNQHHAGAGAIAMYALGNGSATAGTVTAEENYSLLIDNTSATFAGTIASGAITVTGGSNQTVIDADIAFDLTDGSKDTLLITNDKTTSAVGAIGPSIGFGNMNSDRRTSAIAAIRTGGDHDNMGLAFFTHPSDTNNETIVKQLELAHDGLATFAGNIEMGSNSIYTQFIKSNASVRIDIDTDNNQSDRIFIVSNHNAANELFKVDESGSGTFASYVYATDLAAKKPAGGLLQLQRDDSSIAINNRIGTIEFQGDDPTAGTFNTGALIFANAAGTWDTNDYPTKLFFQTDNAGTLTTALTIDDSQNATFAGDVTVTGTLTANTTSTNDLGTAYTTVTTSGTTALINTVTIPASEKGAVYQVVIMYNPNDAGSASYRDVKYGKIIISTGYESSAVKKFIHYIEESPAARDLNGSGGGEKTVEAVFLLSSTESENVAHDAAPVVRFKISAFDASGSTVGANAIVRVKKIM